MMRGNSDGAVKFPTKPFKGDVLLQYVRTAVEKSRALLSREEEIQALRARWADLTSRERDGMSLVVVGLLTSRSAVVSVLAKSR